MQQRRFPGSEARTLRYGPDRYFGSRSLPVFVCRRIPGIQPVMTVKARIAAIQKLEPGDSVGYGMRYTAESRRRIAVLPLGYGDGFPRVRNQGCALVRGRRAPLVGGVAMDALTVDI